MLVADELMNNSPLKSNSSLLKEGVDKLITHRYNLLQINEAINELRFGATPGTVLLNCDI